MLCSFCELDRDHPALGPGVAICSSCVSRARTEQPLRDVRVCSFCGNERDNIALQNPRSGSQICSSCTDIAAEVLAHQR